jgi:restriction endonuclease S subunit
VAGRNVDFVTTIPGRYALSVNDAGMPTPAGWAWTPLSNVARLESGHTPSRSRPEYWDGDIAWIGIKDAREHHAGVIHDTSQHVTQAGIDNSAARLLPAKTVCLSRTASVGYVVVMGRPMATSQDFVNWVCSPALDPDFLKWILLAEGEEGLRKFGKGSTHTTIYFPEVKAFHVCIAPLNEQRRVVARLDAVFEQTRAAKARLERLPALLEKLKRAILAAAFRGDLTKDWRAAPARPDVEPGSVLLSRIRADRRHRWECGLREKGKDPVRMIYQPPADVDASALPELPAGWTWTSLEAITDPHRVIRYGILMPGDDVPGGVPYVKVRNIKQDRVLVDDVLHTTKEMHAKFKGAELAARDLLVTIRGTWGRVAPVPLELVGGNITQDTARIAPLNIVSPEYLAHALRAPWSQKFLDRVAKGMAVKGVNISDLRCTPLPVRPLAEQTRIAESIESALAFVGAIVGAQRAAPPCARIVVAPAEAGAGRC